MIAMIEGTVLEKNENETLLMTAGGVGYRVMCSVNTLSILPAAGETCRLHTYLNVREDAMELSDARLAGIDKLALVLGTEGDGLKPETVADCDYTVRIPMSHGVDSLNVAAASAVAFYQLGTLHR